MIIQGIEIPHQFICPITQRIMQNPVSVNGVNYEHNAICLWLTENNEGTLGETIQDKKITENPNLKTTIFNFGQENKLTETEFSKPVTDDHLRLRIRRLKLEIEQKKLSMEEAKAGLVKESAKRKSVAPASAGTKESPIGVADDEGDLSTASSSPSKKAKVSSKSKPNSSSSPIPEKEKGPEGIKPARLFAESASRISSNLSPKPPSDLTKEGSNPTIKPTIPSLLLINPPLNKPPIAPASSDPCTTPVATPTLNDDRSNNRPQRSGLDVLFDAIGSTEEMAQIRTYQKTSHLNKSNRSNSIPRNLGTQPSHTPPSTPSYPIDAGFLEHPSDEKTASEFDRIKAHLSFAGQVRLEKPAFTIKTSGGGDCAIHALLGDFRGNQITCTDVASVRKRVGDAIRSAKNGDQIFDLIVKSIRDKLMEGGTEFPTLRKAYAVNLKKNETSIMKLQSIFEDALKKHDAINHYIIEKTKHKILKDFWHRYQDCLSMEDGALHALILSVPSLQELYEQYQAESLRELDINTYINSIVLKEYADFFERNGQYLLPVELSLMAHIYNIKVKFYSYDPFKDHYFDTGEFNSGGDTCVGIAFKNDGHGGPGHYERISDSSLPLDNESGKNKNDYKRLKHDTTIMPSGKENPEKEKPNDLPTETVPHSKSKRKKQTKSSEVSLRDIQSSAHAGIADDLFTLGLAYYWGGENCTLKQSDSKACSSIMQNYKKAYKYFKKLVDSNADYSTEALYFLGIMEYEGRGDIPKDPEKAIQNLKLSAQRGYADAQYELARIYRYDMNQDLSNEDKNQLKKNIAKAYELFEQAAKQKSLHTQAPTLAQIELALMYQFGTGVNIDLEKALALLDEAAKSGNNEAENKLGEMYRDGSGTKADAVKACHYFRSSARKGNIEAQLNLAYMLSFGIGTDKNEKEAFDIYKALADQGNTDAKLCLVTYYLNVKDKETGSNKELAFNLCKDLAEKGVVDAAHYLAWLYANGIGTPQNEVEATKWYKVAADAGNVEAQFSLANRYDYEYGIIIDPKNPEPPSKTAFKYYKMAAENGDAAAQNNLGEMYRYGKGVAKDEKEAFRLYRSAARKGNIDAYNNLGEMHKKNNENKKAYECFILAYKQNSSDAAYHLGEMYAEGNDFIKKDETVAFNYFKKAAESDHLGAIYRMGNAYLKGHGVALDHSKAFECFKRGADKDIPNFQYVLGHLYQQGYGVKADINVTKTLWEKAAAKGHIPAKNSLEALSRLSLIAYDYLRRASSPTREIEGAKMESGVKPENSTQMKKQMG